MLRATNIKPREEVEVEDEVEESREQKGTHVCMTLRTWGEGRVFTGRQQFG